MSSILEAFGKAVSMGTQEIIDDARGDDLNADRAERLRILEEALRIEVEQEHADKERVRRLFMDYWACTEQQAPRELTLTLEVESRSGTLIGISGALRCEGRVKLASLEPCEDFLGRFNRWLEDPAMSEGFTGTGELILTITSFTWTSSMPAIEVRDFTNELIGGPLQFRPVVRWLRGAPAVLDLLGISILGQPDDARPGHHRGVWERAILLRRSGPLVKASPTTDAAYLRTTIVLAPSGRTCGGCPIGRAP